MSKNTLYIFTLLVLSLLVIASAITIVQGNTQNKTITFNTGGKVGYLKYYEQYYSVNASGQLVLDQTRIYFDGQTNNSKMKFLLIRPLTKEGTLYPENHIKAIAVLDNVTILNAWYGTPINLQPNNNQTIQHPELLAAIITVMLIAVSVLVRKIIKRKKKVIQT